MLSRFIEYSKVFLLYRKQAQPQSVLPPALGLPDQPYLRAMVFG